MTQNLSAALLLGGALLLAGCQKGVFTPRGGQITFGTVSGDPSTKTAYGDDFVNGGETWQYIDWVAGDEITIVSDEAATYNSDSEEHFANYTVTAVTSLGNHRSGATVAPMPNGLCWKDGYTGPYNFYGVYPATTAISDGTDGAELGTVTANIPAAQTLTASGNTKYVKADGTPTTAGATDVAYTYAVYNPDMSYAVMTAAAIGVQESAAKPQVSLLFKPAFTAFEINLTSKDDGEVFDVSSLSLVAVNHNLSGDFTMRAGADVATAGTVSPGTGSKEVGCSWPESARPQITSTSGFTATLFTLPVTNTDLLTLRVATSDGTASLALTAAGSTSEPYHFEAGQKYRINLLKLGNVISVVSIGLAGIVLPWEYEVENSNFTQNVQSKPFSISGCLETGNHYEEASGYDKYYQLRTLDMSVVKPFFEVKFTPIAPLGGYWNLSAEAAPSEGVTGQGGIEGFRIVLWDGESELSNWSNGQIMNKEITLRIYPSATRDASKEYCMRLVSFFSPNRTGEPTYSADSELQDVHSDGRYSYWKFVIPATE